MSEPIRYDRSTEEVHHYSESAAALQAMRRQIEQQLATARAAVAVIQAQAAVRAAASAIPEKKS